MPIFISYSHDDKEFVDKFATHLVKHRTRVWLDRWELNVGDSIVERVQSAIKDATALIVVLSKASVQSQWCKKELSAGLVRELEESRVIVVPVLVQDCEIPIFLRDKLYADFRKDFDRGLKTTLEAIARVNSDVLGRLGDPRNHTDWAIDWWFERGRFFLRVTLAQFSEDLPYSALTEMVAAANVEATKRQRHYTKKGFPEFGRFLIVTLVAEFASERKLFLRLDDSQAKKTEISWEDPRTGIRYDIVLRARRLGEDNGKDILIDCAGQLEQIKGALRSNARPLGPDELASLIGPSDES